jgi:hypothetical protein
MRSAGRDAVPNGAECKLSLTEMRVNAQPQGLRKVTSLTK